MPPDPVSSRSAGNSSGRREVAAAVILLAAAAMVFSANLYELGRIDRRTQANTDLIFGTERVISNLKDIETGQRGFMLTGRDAYLAPYLTANGELEAQLASLAALGLPLGGLPAKARARLHAAAAGVETRRTGGLDAAVAAIDGGNGLALMDECRSLAAALQQTARRRIGRLDHRSRVTSLLLGGSSFLLLLLSFGSIGLYAARRRRQQAAAAQLLDGVMENAPIGLGLLDRDLRVRHMNRALSAMGDRALGVDVGHSIWEILPELKGSLEQKVRQVVEGGRPVPNMEVSAANASRPDQIRDFEISFYPIRSASGKSEDGAGMVVTDVTTRHRVETRMRESEARFRILTEASAAIIWMATPDGGFGHAQPKWRHFTGQPDDEQAGRGWLNQIHPEDRPATAAGWDRAVADVTPYSVEHRLRRADGDWRYMAMTAVPVLDGDALKEWIGTHTDITERRLAELALASAKDLAEAANRSKSAFLANMSHELRTPLSAVIGYAEMLEEEVSESGDERLLPDLKKIEANARHLLSLINDVLDLSKIEANKMTTFAEDFPVSSLIAEAASTVEALVKKNGNDLVLDLADDLGQMHSDAVKIRQCLFNLISNAAKFTENGRIVLRIRREPDDWLSMQVSDSGIGMTAEQLGRLFQRFTQADESTTRIFGGTGLGLAITKAFCRLLGGDVSVESTPGEGTCFTIRLPARMPAPDVVPQEQEEPPRTLAGDHKELVLVIDDDPGQRDLLTRFLEREGFAVSTAADGPTGLEKARNLRPRTILLDVMMPQMDGWSVLAALKADPLLADIPVVMATFVNEPALAQSLGATDYILKPIEWTQLKTIMDRFREAEGDILIVDDDPDARERLRRPLEANGWSVVEATNGEEALDRVAHSIPQVILLDLTMPIMDGFSFLTALRRRPGCGDIPVVVLSARDLQKGDRDRLKSAARIVRKGDLDLRELANEIRELTPPTPDMPGPLTLHG